MCEENKKEELSILKWRFWDLWLQKIFRNIASMKYQIIIALFTLIGYGMFSGKWVDKTWVAIIPAAIGCGVLGGGFITLVSARIAANTKLVEKNGNSEMDTDS